MTGADTPDPQALLDELASGEPTFLQRWMVEYITNLLGQLDGECEDRPAVEAELASVIAEVWRVEADKKIAEIDRRLAVRLHDVIKSDFGGMIRRVNEGDGPSPRSANAVLLLAVAELYRAISLLWIAVEIAEDEEFAGEPLDPSSTESASMLFAEAFPDLPQITTGDSASSRRTLAKALRQTTDLPQSVADALDSEVGH